MDGRDIRLPPSRLRYRGTDKTNPLTPRCGLPARTQSLRARLFGVDAVVEDEEREPEDPEGVLGAQFVVLDVHVELFGEAMDRQGRELSGGGVDVGQVVARVIEVAAAGEHQTTAGSRGGSRVAVKLACGSGKPTLTYPRPPWR